MKSIIQISLSVDLNVLKVALQLEILCHLSAYFGYFAYICFVVYPDVSHRKI